MKMGHQIQLEIYKIILDTLKSSYSSMKNEIKLYFIHKMSQLEPEDVNDKVIEIVTELCKKGNASVREPDLHV